LQLTIQLNRLNDTIINNNTSLDDGRIYIEKCFDRLESINNRVSKSFIEDFEKLNKIIRNNKK